MTSSKAKIIYEVKVGEFTHRYSLRDITWSIYKDIAPIWTMGSDDEINARRMRDIISGSLVPNISITLDEPIIGTIIIDSSTETITLVDVKLIDEDLFCNSLVADRRTSWVCENIEPSTMINLGQSVQFYE